jgi:hypothetical protein
VCDNPDTCDANGVCANVNHEPDGTACDNTTVCDGREVCGSGTCNPGTPLSCGDGNACNGTETCDPVLGCVGGTPVNCDDGNPCTEDSCDPTSGACGHVGECASDALIAPTATTCQDYNGGTATDLEELLYGTRGGAINSVSPGVFFLYDTVTVGACGTLTITESDGLWTQIILARTGQVILYSTSCSKLNVGSVSINQATGQVTITGVDPGDYILGIKYDPTTLKGYTPPSASTLYTFGVSSCGGPTESADIEVNPKP